MAPKRRRAGPGHDRDRPDNKKTRYKQVYCISSKAISGQGIFVTCVMGKERKAAAQLIDRLNEIADVIYKHVVLEKPKRQEEEKPEEELDEDELMDRMRNGPAPEKVKEAPKKEEEPAKVEETIKEKTKEDSLEAQITVELAQLKGKSSQALLQRFKKIETDTECLVFISVARPICPYKMVYTLLTEVESSGEPHTRFVQRLSPVSDTCAANFESVESLATRIIPPFFPSDAAKKFKIDPRIRSHSTLKRDQLIQIIASAIPREGGHHADLANPDYWIVVEVHKNVCAIGVVSHFERFKKLNVQKVAEAVHAERAKAEAGAEGRVAGSLKV